MPKVQNLDNGGGRRRGRGARVGSSLSEINVVPLVDVMLVLLIIFMVTAPMMQQGLPVNLPQSRRSQPVNTEPVYVTVPATFRQNRIVQIGDEPINVTLLAERITQALLTRDDKSVGLRGDGSVTLQDLYEVFDKLKEAGVEKVGIFSQPPQR
jgi:biopolymer transport protein TolR